MKINNSPPKSLEWRIHQLLCRNVHGCKRSYIDLRFRKEAPQNIDAALECLRSTGIAACTNGVWFVRSLQKARTSGR